MISERRILQLMVNVSLGIVLTFGWRILQMMQWYDFIRILFWTSLFWIGLDRINPYVVKPDPDDISKKRLVDL